MALLIYCYLLQELGAVAAQGATPGSCRYVALLIDWATGEKVGVLEIATIFLVLVSITMLQIGHRISLNAARVFATIARTEGPCPRRGMTPVAQTSNAASPRRASRAPGSTRHSGRSR